MSVWITRVPVHGPGPRLAVKDNVDVAGLPTTCAHPAYAYVPQRSATAVQRLVDAGFVVVGKTNLDQFATGLVGTRSPYGPVENPVVPGRIAGGSSSGSAVAVATGEADLAIGTDTAGSGRVPAALCGVVGLKPTVGLVPTDGVVPACPSLDCVSIFARTVNEAAAALTIMTGRPSTPIGTPVAPVGPMRIGIPATVAGLDPHAEPAWTRAIEDLERLGALVEIDPAPYLAAGELVYGAAFLCERQASFGDFLAAHPEGTDPVVAAVVGRTLCARDVAAERSLLPALAAEVAAWWESVDVVCVPTTGIAPTFEAVAADPIGLNLQLGRYTAGANPLRLCAAAVPAGHRDDGVPFGVTFLGPPHADPVVAVAAARLVGEPDPPPPPWAGWTDLAVVGAHLDGQPLNHELVAAGARKVRRTTTAPEYRLVALSTDPPKPGLVRTDAGAPIEVEVWRVPTDAFGRLVGSVRSPLGIGEVKLADGTSVHGFLCEPLAAAEATDITGYGGWRAYLAGTRLPA